MKKLLSVLLAVMMLLSSLPVMATEVDASTPVVVDEKTPTPDEDKEIVGDKEPEVPSKHVNHTEENKINDSKDINHYAYLNCDECKGESYTAANHAEDTWVKYHCQAEGCDHTFTVTTKGTAHVPTYTDETKQTIKGTITKDPTCGDGTDKNGEGKVETMCSVEGCNVKFEVTLDPAPHTYGEQTVKAPTCTEKGYTTETCSTCGYVHNFDEKDALKHDWTGDREWTPNTPLVCYGEDTKIVSFLSCQNGCGETKDYSDGSMNFTNLDQYHQLYIENLLIVNANTTAAKVASAILKEAGDDNLIAATAVDYLDVKSEDSGYDVALNATKVEYKAPTCYEPGYITLSCAGEGEKNCGATHTLEIPAREHKYYVDDEWLWNDNDDNGDLNIPTCLTSGSVLIHCSQKGCNFEEQATITAPGAHNWNDEQYIDCVFTQVTVKNGEVEIPGRIEDGEVYLGYYNEDGEWIESEDKLVECMPYEVRYFCKGVHTNVVLENGDIVWVDFDCRKLSSAKTVEATEEHTVNKNDYAYFAPTCTEPGYEKSNCVYCGETTERAVAPYKHVKHDATGESTGESAYSYDPETDKVDPTCTEPGSITWTCELCGDVKVQELPATGHGWDYDKNDFHWKWNKKPVCGKEENGSQTWYCDYCDATKDVVVEFEHQPGTDVTSDPATCTESGERSYTCTVCHNLVKEAIDPLGHTWARKETDKTEMVKLAATSEWNTTKVDQYYDKYEEATCEAKGYYERTCDDPNCDKKNTKTNKAYTEKLEIGEKLNHVLVSAGVDGTLTQKNLILDTKNMPTCSSTGKAYFNCARCGVKAGVEMTLPALPHNPVMTWNDTKNVYEITCEVLEWPEDSNSVYYTLMKDYLYDEIIAHIDPNLPKAVREERAEEYQEKAIMDIRNILKEKKIGYDEDGDAYNYYVVRGVGCDEVIREIPVVKTHYDAKINNDGTITIKAVENCALLEEPRLIVSWAYTLSDGTSMTVTGNYGAKSYTEWVKVEEDGDTWYEKRTVKELTYVVNAPEVDWTTELVQTTIAVTTGYSTDLGAAYVNGYGWDVVEAK